MPTWVRRPVSRQFYRRQTLLRAPVTAATVDVTEFTPVPSGVSGVFLYDTNWNAVAGLAGPIVPIVWRTSRYQNRVGEWTVTLPVDDQLSGTTPIHTQIRRGWHLCLVQENNHPENRTDREYLLYMGVVLKREYVAKEGGASAVLQLTGAFRTQHLVERSTLGSLSFASGTMAGAMAVSLVNESAYIGPNGGIYASAALGTTGGLKFNHISRYEALLKVAELGRCALRDSWDFDRPELTATWGPPDPGISFVKVESYDPGLDQAGEHGIALIGGLPKVTFDGTGLVNRVIPIGADTPEGELTLASSNQSSPYVIQSGIDSGGNTYRYLEDALSVATHGLVERRMLRGDVRNPSDDAGTRTASANVLYARAVDYLIKNRSEKLFFECEVANGPNIWALPGDMVRVDYTGIALDDEDNRVVWVDIAQKRMVVAERHDESDPSGVRRVRFVLAAPLEEFPIPELPDAIVLPPMSVAGSGASLFDALRSFFEGLEASGEVETPEGDEPSVTDPDAGEVFTPLGVIRTNDDVLEYWDGSTWQNLGDSLDTSDPGGGKVWLSAS